MSYFVTNEKKLRHALQTRASRDNEVYIETSGLAAGAQLHIEFYDILGKKVMQEAFENSITNIISLASMPQGLYLYKIYDLQGVLVTDHLIIIRE
ncbi:MAG: T9SS type A sorting domain-containing protein [Bacteroidota bacterium]